jgi:hypothetical protein
MLSDDILDRIDAMVPARTDVARSASGPRLMRSRPAPWTSMFCSPAQNARGRPDRHRELGGRTLLM